MCGNLPLVLPLAMCVLLGSTVLMSCTKARAERVVTLAKLQNLKSAMCLLTQLVLNGDRPFPKKAQDIIDFMEQEAGYEPSKHDPKDTPFTDGWGNEMRIQGNERSYTIRSAGPDEVFDTEDDIYLAGNPDGEYIIDGSREKNISGKDLMKSRLTIPFQEPNGYYRISLPGKYVVIKRYSGWRSEITFSYTKNNSVTIIADPIKEKWQREREMEKRVDRIQSGEDESFSDYEIIQYNLTSINDAPGYEIMLKRDAFLAHAYHIVGNDYIGLSISIIASGKDRQFIMNTLTNAIKKSLDIR
jgi:hypothetical protein